MDALQKTKKKTLKSSQIRPIQPAPPPESQPFKFAPQKELINSLNMRFIFIPAGRFMMGSPSDEQNRNESEIQHRVTLTNSFYMAASPVTVGQWRQFVLDTGSQTEAEKGNGAIVKVDGAWQKSRAHSWQNPGFDQTDNHPVTCVAFIDIMAFIRWLSQKENKCYRLPTEAEWEYACRAGTTTPFYTGLKLTTDQANYNATIPQPGKQKGDFRARTTPIETFPPNAWGLTDMHGNVWERCLDYYGEYPFEHVTDPKGPPSGRSRIDRGGSWDSHAEYCRSAYRGASISNDGSSISGFRLVFIGS